MRFLYALASFCIAGLGQFLQQRFDRAALFFCTALICHVASFAFCGPFGGLIVHIIAAYDAATWKGEA